ncbi:bile acid:sodium symporter family protein [Cryptosporangium aurantiacum]|uniref:Solute carrier family 10 (Sodium/bile acid cotransporter), member 7 n=1 Tax=Cryptosporangium aurantiacum TaxID=134849 RepID=A0A1M7MIJ2_9ACTN|nr:bile acid:sodium symporter family protein [Cryptosporangium aurantiacum]SHM90732.1 solute carrier family 10 (sodium/bile acid cotransporter), member 7 [Cryptosporangium aurantiacum]
MLRRFRPDPYIVALLTMVALASALPARGVVEDVLDQLIVVAIGFLFFLYGARLSTETVIAGIKHWRLHLLVLAFTFVLFPVLGLVIRLLPDAVLSSELAAGVVFLCLLPSTVQSSIAFVSIAKGNVAAAICTASLSNVLGVVLTPVLVAVLLSDTGMSFSGGTVLKIVVQLLVPFALGQALRPWIGGFVGRHKKVLGLLDRGSILLVVYTAFSGAVVAGVWSSLSGWDLVALVAVCVVLLAAVLLITGFVSRKLGFNREDRITIVFAGSKKSLATGVPMATVLFAGTGAGLVILPLMLFHQLQLIVCAVLARRWGAAPASSDADSPATAPTPATA